MLVGVFPPVPLRSRCFPGGAVPCQRHQFPQLRAVKCSYSAHRRGRCTLLRGRAAVLAALAERWYGTRNSARKGHWPFGTTRAHGGGRPPPPRDELDSNDRLLVSLYQRGSLGERWD